MNDDAPVTGEAKSPDLLNRAGFVKRLARLLLESPKSTGLALSIEGPWGYGKTSVLNLLEREFSNAESKSRPLLFRFNPWIIGSHEKLIQSFLVQLAAKAGAGDHAAAGEKAAKELLAYSSVFSALKLIPGAEPFASMVEGVINAVGGAAKKISDLKELDVERRKRAVVEALSLLDRKIIVFIDDFDRLPPVEVFEMIRLVKAVGDFPGVNYVLCYDPRYIAGALMEAGISNAAGYLDKIIQLRVSLPMISRTDLGRLVDMEYASFSDETKATFSDNEERVQELYFEALRFLFETPRDIKRVFNRLRVSEPGCRGEVNIGDLLGLETLAVKAPSVYEQIRTRPELYAGQLTEEKNVYDVFHEEKPDGVKRIRDSAMESVTDPNRRHVRALVVALFPSVNSDHIPVAEVNSKQRGRIASKDRLDIALASGVPSDEFPYALAQLFFANGKSRGEISRQALEQHKLRRFLAQLSVAAEDAAPAEPESYSRILAQLPDSSEAIADTATRQDGVLGSAAREASALIQQALASVEPQLRAAILNGILSDDGACSVATLLLIELRRQHGLHGAKDAVSTDKRWCNDSELQELQQLWLRTVQSLAQTGKLFDAIELRPLLYLLSDIDADVARSTGQLILSNDANMDSLALRVAYAGTDSVNGRYAQVRAKFFEPFGKAEDFISKASERLKDSNVTGELRYSLMAIALGTPVYLKDGTQARH